MEVAGRPSQASPASSTDKGESAESQEDKKLNLIRLLGDIGASPDSFHPGANQREKKPQEKVYRGKERFWENESVGSAAVLRPG